MGFYGFWGAAAAEPASASRRIVANGNPISTTSNAGMIRFQYPKSDFPPFPEFYPFPVQTIHRLTV
jgi:hypothetical protein